MAEVALMTVIFLLLVVVVFDLVMLGNWTQDFVHAGQAFSH
jgi:hypothetical protein